MHCSGRDVLYWLLESFPMEIWAVPEDLQAAQPSHESVDAAFWTPVARYCLSGVLLVFLSACPSDLSPMLVGHCDSGSLTPAANEPSHRYKRLEGY